MITKIIIRNFKSIKNLDIDMRPINVLIGSNGVGKSNFINFFKLVSRIYDQRLQEYIGNNIDALLYFGRKKSEYLFGLIEFSKKNNSYKNVVYFQINPKNQSNTGFIVELADRFNYGSKNQEYNSDYKKWNKETWDSNQEESSLKDKEIGRVNYIKEYLESFRIYHFHDTSDTSPLKTPCNLNDNRYLAENGRNLAAYLYYLQEKRPKAFKKIEMQIRSIAPFFDRFDLAPDRLNESQIELRWLEKGNEISFNAHYLSDGTLRFMALSTLLLQPEPPKVILIDEPELGLHPFAIGKLAGMIQSAAGKAQIIAATQSPSLISHFQPEDVIVIDRSEKENQTIFTRLNSDSLKTWLDEYSLGDLWERNIINSAQPFNK